MTAPDLSLLTLERQRRWSFRRLMIAPHIGLCTLAGAGPFVDAGSFASPLFDTFRAVAPLTVWGVIWLATGAALMTAAVSHRFAPYVAGHVMLSAISTFWLLVLAKARWIDHIPASSTAFGLWLVPSLYAVLALLTTEDEQWTSRT